MRVLSLTTIYPHEQNNAEGRSVAFLDRALAAQGVEGTTLVLKPYLPHWLARRVQKWKHLAVRDVAQTESNLRVFFTHYLHVPIRYSLTQCADSMAQRAMQLIAQHHLKFDLVHAESIYPAALAAQRVAARYQVPFIVTLRDVLSHLGYMYKTRPASRAVFEPMFANVAALFVIGPEMEREAHKYFVGNASPPVIRAPNGIDVAALDSYLPAVLAPPPMQGALVSVSSLMRYKGIHENLKALQSLTQRHVTTWHYTIVGEGPYRSELEALTESLGLTQRVSFVGKLAHRDAIRAIAAHDIFVLPSWAEAFGNVYAEAAVCERPAIGCHGNGAEWLIRDGETGLLVPPKSVEALADAIEFLLTHPERARAMGKAARQHIGQFTWERTASIYKQTLTDLLRGQTSRHANEPAFSVAP